MGVGVAAPSGPGLESVATAAGAPLVGLGWAPGAGTGLWEGCVADTPRGCGSRSLGVGSFSKPVRTDRERVLAAVELCLSISRLEGHSAKTA